MGVILPTTEAPFGFLEPIHQYILHNATPLTLTNWPFLFILPLTPLGLVCLLIQFPDTKQYRLPLSALGIGLIIHAVGHYRFDDLEYNAFNNGIGIAAMHLVGKYVEFGLLNQPIIDPYVARGTRSRYLAAIDLAINSRMVGLGTIKLDKTATQQSSNSRNSSKAVSNDRTQADGGVESKGDIIPHHREGWLPYTSNPNRSSISAVFRHIRKAIGYYTVLDTLMAILWHFGGSTIANPNGMVGAVQSFLDTSHFVLFPNSYKLGVPTLVVAVIMEVSLATAVWQAISMGYHTFAAIAVGSGLWEVEAWEVDIYDSPWKADSILNMWGRRWHQLFRHHFLLVSTLILQTLRLPVSPPLVLPLIFFLSGAMHALGQIGMSPVPNPSRLGLFFILSGIGCALEATFRKVTGRRVRGTWGRIWMWSYFLYTGRWTAMTWLEGGLGGNRLVPADFAYRPGPIIAHFMTTYLFDTVQTVSK